MSLMIETKRRGGPFDTRDRGRVVNTSNSKETSRTEGQAETGRLEAFSDGVFAVAITLLALGLVVPSLDEAGHTHSVGPFHGLAAALLRQWPSYLAYALSFLNVLIMWVNHHALFRIIRRTDHLFLLLNGLLLLVVTVFPFATLLLATYLEQPDVADRKTAQIVYAGLSLVLALAFNQSWRYAARDGLLLDPAADPRQVRGISSQYAFGPPLYLGAVALTFVSAEVSLALCILLSRSAVTIRRICRVKTTSLQRLAA